MPAWLAVLIEALRTSFWAIPAVMVVLAIGAAFALPLVDQRFVKSDALGQAVVWKLIFDGSAEGARELLGTIAGSALTVAGVVFSVTIATLSMAAGQYGPRLLRQFIGDRGNQFTLGVFVGTYTYCLVLLRTMPGGDFADSYTPHLAMTTALGLAMLSIGVLIWFIHHLAQRMQPAELVDDVGRRLDSALSSAHESRVGEPCGGKLDTLIEPGDTDRIRTGRVGYIEAIDYGELLDLADQHGLRLRLLVRPGTFVFDASALLQCYPKGRADDALKRKLQRACLVSPERTLAQDAEFGMDQLSEMAIRALSPGINDPRTAMTCINRLGAALAKECGRERVDPVRGVDGEPRLVLQTSDFAGLLGTAFDGIRQAAERSFSVQLRLIEVLIMISRSATRPEQCAALRRMIELVKLRAEEGLLDGDLQALRDRLDEAEQVFNGGPDDESAYRE
ncbi:MAG: DUF2254 domain-containing protein [Planctomycetota bacterium]